MDSYRLKRVAHLLREQLSGMILKGEIKDPRVSSLASISNVEVSKDLAYAKVFISSFEDHERLDSVVEGLNHAAGYIQGIVGKRIKLRNTPKITFFADHAIEEGFLITEKIKEVLP
jgi:ribosome-binding factor A